MMNKQGSFDSFGTFLRTVESNRKTGNKDPSRQILELTAAGPQKMAVLIRATKQSPRELSEHIRDLDYMSLVKVDNEGAVSITANGLEALGALNENSM